VITDGHKTVATLHLAGNYAGDVFSVASDGGGGSIITVAGATPAAHRFIAAMAGLGATSGPSIGSAASLRAEVHPVLSIPAPGQLA
jgi:hypothetical protein